MPPLCGWTSGLSCFYGLSNKSNNASCTIRAEMSRCIGDVLFFHIYMGHTVTGVYKKKKKKISTLGGVFRKFFGFEASKAFCVWRKGPKYPHTCRLGLNWLRSRPDIFPHDKHVLHHVQRMRLEPNRPFTYGGVCFWFVCCGFYPQQTKGFIRNLEINIICWQPSALHVFICWL